MSKLKQQVEELLALCESESGQPWWKDPSTSTKVRDTFPAIARRFLELEAENARLSGELAEVRRGYAESIEARERAYER